MSLLNHSDLQPLFDNNRLSNTDSGFVSIHSHRNSVQSYSTSKRSSQQSSSSQWSQQNSFKHVANFVTNEIQKTEITEKIETNIQYSSLTHDFTEASIDSVDSSITEDVPPKIPQKTRSRRGRHERQPSPYDNVPDNMGGELLVTCSMHQSQSKSSSVRSSTDVDENEPPPLPVKKRHSE